MFSVSSKTVSAWERGYRKVRVDTFKKILELDNSAFQNAYVLEKKDNYTYVYYCRYCKNVIVSAKPIKAECCGSIIENCVKRGAENILCDVVRYNDNLVVTIHHDMTKIHYISEIIYCGRNMVSAVRLRPGDTPVVKFKDAGNGELLINCNRMGWTMIQV